MDYAPHPSPTSTASRATPAPDRALLYCALAVLGFSFTLPATRVAAAELPALILGPGRGVLSGLAAAAILLWRRERPPTGTQLRSLALVGVGVVLGFPLLTTLALEHAPAHHAVIVVGLVPLCTSLASALRNGERPSLAFWLFALAGASAVLTFGVLSQHALFERADLWLLAAVLLVALGYAEGGRLAAQLGGVRVICWALVLTLPCTLGCVAIGALCARWSVPGWPTLAAFIYVSLVSTLLCFCAWYRGLALGGVARGSQVQLLQPLLSLIWCALLLGEPLARGTLVTGLAVLVSAAGSRRTQGPAARRSGARALDKP